MVALSNRSVDRRRFLQGAAALAGGLAAAPALQGLGLLQSNGRALAAPGNGSYGPLFPTPDLRDGVERIALPKGFRYRSFGHAGEMMSDGNLTPLAHDGMAAYHVRGSLRLVRNHEDRNGPNNGTVAGSSATRYDPVAGGGTTTLIIDPETRELVRDWVSLSGSTVNCAGGATPWDSWITCEETNAGTPSGWTKQHGYCFDVPASANSIVEAVAIPEMGRFSHEACAVDPDGFYVYETEDAGSNSGFYRFVPRRKGRLVEGGRLQMLAIDGQPNYDTRTGQTVGQKLRVVWVDIDEPNPAGTGSSDVFNQGFAAGGARFARLEGIWTAKDSVYFNSTSGGNAEAGQVWEFKSTGRDKGWLTLVFESPSADVLDAPDNLTVSPQGAVLLCEDGDDDQYLRTVTKRGEIFDFALNLQTEHEWAGATFAVTKGSNGRGRNDDHDDDRDRDRRRNDARSRAEDILRRYDIDIEVDDRVDRDERRSDDREGGSVTLFVNRQGSTSGGNPPTEGNEGMTFAIWGPWKNGAL